MCLGLAGKMCAKTFTLWDSAGHCDRGGEKVGECKLGGRGEKTSHRELWLAQARKKACLAGPRGDYAHSSIENKYMLLRTENETGLWRRCKSDTRCRGWFMRGNTSTTHCDGAGLKSICTPLFYWTRLRKTMRNLIKNTQELPQLSWARKLQKHRHCALLGLGDWVK